MTDDPKRRGLVMTRAEVLSRFPIGTEVWVRATIRDVSNPLSHELDAHPGEVVICVEFEHPSVGAATHILGDPTQEETIYSSIRPIT